MKLTKLLEKEQRWKNAKRRGRFWRDIGDINPEKDARMSDNGAGARRIFAACDNLQDEENAWLNAFYDAIDRLPSAEITIVRTLMCDFRSGWFAKKDSKATLENVRVTSTLLGEGDHVYLRLIDTDGTVLEDNSQDHRVASSTDTEITSGDSGFWPDDSEYPDGEWDEEGRTVKLRVVKADGTAAERRVYLDDGE